MFDSHIHIFPVKYLPKEITYKQLEVGLARYKDVIAKLHQYELDGVVDGLLDVLGLGSNVEIEYFLSFIVGTVGRVMDLTRMELEKSGIDGAWVLNIDYGIEEQADYGRYKDYWRLQMEHEYQRTSAGFKPFYRVFIGVDPRRKGIVKDVRELLDEGFGGIKMYPPIGWGADDEDIRFNMRGIIEAAIEYRVPIVVHTSRGGIRGPHGKTSHADPQRWEWVFDEYGEEDGLTFIFAHGGGYSDFKDYAWTVFVKLRREWWEKHKFGDELLKEEREAEKDSWFGIIYTYMQEWESVFMDIAYYDGLYSWDKRGVGAVGGALKDAWAMDRIIYGSDFPLTGGQWRYDKFWRHVVDAGLNEHLERNQLRILERIKR